MLVAASVMLDVALRLTVVSWMVSVIDVTAGALLTTRFSKLPPVALLMLALTVVGSR